MNKYKMNGSEFLSLGGKAKEASPYYFSGFNEKAVKFYISMLSISLILGLLYCGFLVYKRWINKTELLSHILNLIIALLCRTFFSLLVAAIVYLNNSNNTDGKNTLLSLECIFLNIVLAYWCILSIYIHGKTRSKEVDMTLYSYGMPAVALFFSFVWIFAMTSELKFVWIFVTYIPQWIVQSIRLLFLIIQLTLVIDMGRLLISKKSSLDNDCKSLLIKLLVVMLGLLLVFWLQFGFSTGAHLILSSPDSFFYFWCFVDGFELALLCPLLYLFEIWGGIYLNGDNFILTTSTKSNPLSSTPVREEVLCKEDTWNRISTIHSIYANMENDKSMSHTNDVVFSSVVGTEKLQKTMNLYNRFNVLAENRATYFQNEEFFDCIDEESVKSQRNSRRNSSATDVYQDIEIGTSHNIKTVCPNDKKTLQYIQFDGIQKKNAFYKSKYLIVDDKQRNLPKNLKTRASVLSESRINVREQNNEIHKPNEVEKELPKHFLNVKESHDTTDNLKIYENSFQYEVKTKSLNPERIAQSVKGAEYSNSFMSTFTEKTGQNADHENYHSDSTNVSMTNIADDVSQTGEAAPVHQLEEFTESVVLLPSNKCETKVNFQKEICIDAQDTPEFHSRKSTKTHLGSQENIMSNINMHIVHEDEKNDTMDAQPMENNINYMSNYKNVTENKSNFRQKKLEEVIQAAQNMGDFKCSLVAHKNFPQIEIYNTMEMQRGKKEHRNRNSISSNFYIAKKQTIDNFIQSPENSLQGFDKYENQSSHHKQLKKRVTKPETKENAEVIEKDTAANFENVMNESTHGFSDQQETQYDKDSVNEENITNYGQYEKQTPLFRALNSILSIFYKERKSIPPELENDFTLKTPSDLYDKKKNEINTKGENELKFSNIEITEVDSDEWRETILRDKPAGITKFEYKNHNKHPSDIETSKKVERLQPQEHSQSYEQVVLNFEEETTHEKVHDGTSKEENIVTNAEKVIDMNFTEMNTTEKEDTESVKMIQEDKQEGNLQAPENEERLQTQKQLPYEDIVLNFTNENYLTNIEGHDNMWYPGEKVERQSKKIGMDCTILSTDKENTEVVPQSDEYQLAVNKMFLQNEIVEQLENSSTHKNILLNSGSNSFMADFDKFQKLDKDLPLNLEYKTKNIPTLPEKLHSSLEFISSEIYDELVLALIKEINTPNSRKRRKITGITSSQKNMYPIRISGNKENNMIKLNTNVQNISKMRSDRITDEKQHAPIMSSGIKKFSTFKRNKYNRKYSLSSESDFEIEKCCTLEKPSSIFNLNEYLNATKLNKSVYSSSESEFGCEGFNILKTFIRRTQSDSELTKAENFRLSADTKSRVFRYSFNS